MLVSQIGKAKAKAIIFRSAGFQVAGTLGIPGWKQWTTSTPKQTCKKPCPKKLANFWTVGQNYITGQNHRLPQLSPFPAVSRLLGELLSEEFGTQALKDPDNFSERQKDCFCVTVQDFISLLSSFLSAEHRLVASLQKALWDACCNVHINYH